MMYFILSRSDESIDSVYAKLEFSLGGADDWFDAPTSEPEFADLPKDGAISYRASFPTGALDPLPEIFDAERLVSERLFELLNSACPALETTRVLLSVDGRPEPLAYRIIRRIPHVVARRPASDARPGDLQWADAAFDPIANSGRRLIRWGEENWDNADSMIVDEALADEIRKADIKAVGLSAMEPTPGGGPTTISADLQ